MTNAELIALFYYCGIALALALGLVLVQSMFFSLESRFSRWMLPTVPLALCLGVGLSSLLSNRNLRYASLDIRTITSLDGASGGGATRALTAIVLAVCFAKVVTKLMQWRDRRMSPVGGKALMLTLALYFGSTHVLSAALGAYPTFIHNSYYPIIVFLAVFMARSDGLEPSIQALKFGLVLLVVGSLVAAVALPALAVQSDYAGWVPGLKFRLWGLGSNANSIGPLALLLALVLYLRPYRSQWLNVLLWLCLLTVFVLAQSKTVWAASLISGFVLLVYGRSRDTQGRVKPGFILTSLVIATVVIIAVAVTDIDRIADRIAATRAGGEISTLTGRVMIWAEAWHIWQDNFWFGYGPDAWGPWHRAVIGMPFAFHAHNQLMNSLSSAGLFGGLTMLAYLACMLVASVRAARVTRGVSLALAVMMLARVMTEAPLELDGLFVGETIIQLAWFMIVLLPYAQRAVDRRPVEPVRSHEPSVGQLPSMA